MRSDKATGVCLSCASRHRCKIRHQAKGVVDRIARNHKVQLEIAIEKCGKWKYEVGSASKPLVVRKARARADG